MSMLQWGWPQWVVLAALAARFVGMLSEIRGEVRKAKEAGKELEPTDKISARVAFLLLWIVVLGAGGFFA